MLRFVQFHTQSLYFRYMLPISHLLITLFLQIQKDAGLQYLMADDVRLVSMALDDKLSDNN